MGRKAQNIVKPIDATMDTLTANVFSGKRVIHAPDIKLPASFKLNKRLKMDGLDFLSRLPESAIPVAFFDPQYRGVLDKMNYGNEGKDRGRKRSEFQQMSDDTIARFIKGIDKTLIPSGHLFLWTDKFHLCQGIGAWLDGTQLDIVDLVIWDKGVFGMGYRTRRRSEYCFVLQKQPRKAKGVWKIHNIPDVICERVIKKTHPHQKPIDLQGELLAAVTHEGDIVIDPAAGGFSVMESAMLRGRSFLGCDING